MLLRLPSQIFYLIDWGAYVPAVITLLGGGGFATAIILLLKARPEVGQIVVTSAQGAVIVQTGVIDNLHKELRRVNDENTQLRTQLTHETQEREKLQEALRQETEALETLKEQFTELEQKLKLLSTRTDAIENK